MNELEQIRKAATELAAKLDEGSLADRTLALENVTRAFKSLSELEKTQAETKKITTEEQKALYDLTHASSQERLAQAKVDPISAFGRLWVLHCG